jgi:hypothetical protein
MVFCSACPFSLIQRPRRRWRGPSLMNSHIRNFGEARSPKSKEARRLVIRFSDLLLQQPANYQGESETHHCPCPRPHPPQAPTAHRTPFAPPAVFSPQRSSAVLPFLSLPSRRQTFESQVRDPRSPLAFQVLRNADVSLCAVSIADEFRSRNFSIYAQWLGIISILRTLPFQFNRPCPTATTDNSTSLHCARNR